MMDLGNNWFGIDFSAARRLPRWEIFEKVLLVAVVLDLALGGNGYLIKLGPLRLRELFFVLCMGWVALRLTTIKPVRLDANLLVLSAAFVAVTALGAVLGYLNGSRFEAIVAEIKPLSYFPMLFFFLVAMRTRSDLTLVAGLLVACGTLLATLYLLLLLSADIGLVTYTSIYEALHHSDEFIFRHNPSNQGVFVGFLYKGAFYICVAALFLIFDPFKLTKVFAAVAVVAIVLTLTRGLGLALAACVLAGLTLQLQRYWRRAPLLLGLCGLLLAIMIFAQRAEMALLIQSGDVRAQRPATAGNAADACPSGSPCRDPLSPLQSLERPSDNERINDFRFVIDKLDFSMTAIGRGFGAPIRGRERIELNYLEIFYKQGILGLSVWFALFVYTTKLYRAIPNETREFALAYFLSSLFVFVATASNTFLTGSIGMAVVFISTAGLLVLAREDPQPMPRWAWYGPWLSRAFGL